MIGVGRCVVGSVVVLGLGMRGQLGLRFGGFGMKWFGGPGEGCGK